MRNCFATSRAFVCGFAASPAETKHKAAVCLISSYYYCCWQSKPAFASFVHQTGREDQKEEPSLGCWNQNTCKSRKVCTSWSWKDRICRPGRQIKWDAMIVTQESVQLDLPISSSRKSLCSSFSGASLEIGAEDWPVKHCHCVSETLKQEDDVLHLSACWEMSLVMSVSLYGAVKISRGMLRVLMNKENYHLYLICTVTNISRLKIWGNNERRQRCLLPNGSDHKKCNAITEKRSSSFRLPATCGELNVAHWAWHTRGRSKLILSSKASSLEKDLDNTLSGGSGIGLWNSPALPFLGSICAVSWKSHFREARQGHGIRIWHSDLLTTASWK